MASAATPHPSRNALLLLICACLFIVQSRGEDRCILTTRKDYYLDQYQYHEAFWHDPTTGGRAIVTCNCTSTSQFAWPFSVSLKSSSSNTWYNATVDSSSKDVDSAFDWISVFGPHNLSASRGGAGGGCVVSVGFHTQLDDALGPFSHVSIADSRSRVVVDGARGASEQSHSIVLSYFTTQHGLKDAVLHLDVNSSSSASIVRIDASTSSGATASAHYGSSGEPLEGHQHKVVVLPFKGDTPVVGDSFIVSLTEHGGAQSTYAGWVVKEQFPINSWPKSEDCPYPSQAGGNRTTQLWYWSMNIDNNYWTVHNCPDKDKAKNLPHMLRALSAQNASLPGNGVSSLLVPCTGSKCSDLLNKQWPYEQYGLPATLLAWYGCDECDKPPVGDSVQQQWREFQSTRDLLHSGGTGETIARTPTLLNGHSSRLIGMYEGMASIVSMDFYIGGCAPHVTDFFDLMEALGAFRYVDAGRRNHNPQTNWGYSQWATNNWDSLPSATSNVFQVGSAIAAGVKGVMLFQNNYDAWHQLYSHDDREQMESALVQVRTLAQVGALREGNVRDGWDGGVKTPYGDKCDEAYSWAVSDSDRVCVVRVIESPKYLTIVVLNAKAYGYDSITCAIKVQDRWYWEALTIDSIDVSLPGGRKLDMSKGCMEPDAKDVGKLVHSASSCAISSGGMSIGKVEFTSDQVVRYFVVPYAEAP